MSPSDSELVVRCLAADQNAWRILVERYSRLVYSIPRRYGLSSADVEDVFQTVFSRFSRRLPLLRDPSRVPAWLIQTATRESWRVRKKTARGVQIDPATIETASPEEPDLADFEREQGVRDALAELDPRCRDLLTALFRETPPPSYETVANRLGIPVGSLGPTRSRCLEKLGSLLKERGY